MEGRLRRLLGPEGPTSAWPRSRRLGALLILLAAGGVFLLWFGPFLRDPAILPPGPDVPWYVWRTELLATRPPEALVRFEGPLEAFKGAYRVANPVLGGLFRGVAEVDRYTLSTIFSAGWNVLAAVAAGAVAFRFRRDPVLFAATALFAAGTLLLNPFVGWVDNVFVLLLGSAVLWFLPDARRSWPARGAVGLFVAVSFFAHPPAAGVLTAVLAGTAVLGMALRGRRGVREEGPLLAVVLGAALLALVAWRAGIWGLSKPLTDAVNPPPYRPESFFQAALSWVRATEPLRFVPLLLAGLGVVALSWRRFREDPLPRALTLWLLPVLGMLGFFLGLDYPFKRFLNVTLAPVLLAGIGVWAVVRPFLWRALPGPGQDGGARRRWVLGLAGAVLAALIVGTAWADGIRAYRGRADWMWPAVRTAMTAVRAYIAEDPDRPIVFVMSAGRRAPREALYGAKWRGNWSVLRAGLPGRHLNDTYVYLGSIRDLLAGRPTVKGGPTLDLLSASSFEVMQEGLGGRRPNVFVINRLNDELGNRQFIYSGRSVRLGTEVVLLRGPDFAPPDPEAVEAAKAADLRTRRWMEDPGFLAGPGDLFRGALGMAFILVLPGLLAARWMGVRDLAGALGTVPALSLSLNVAAGLVVLAVWRQPLTPDVAWVIVGMATLAGAAMFGAARRRDRDRGKPTAHHRPAPRTTNGEREPVPVGAAGGPPARRLPGSPARRRSRPAPTPPTDRRT